MSIGVNNNTTSLVDKLKRERDRFIAFAFASADILMELDKEGRIIYIDGASKRLLDLNPEEIINKTFAEIVSTDDIDLAKYLLKTDARSRIDNIAIRLTTKQGASYPFIMSGYKISELQGHFYITFSTFRNDINMNDLSWRDLKTGLLKKAEFSLAVNRQIILSKYSEQVPFMTMIIIEGGHELLASFEDNSFDEISDAIKKASINGDSAGMIKDNIIGFVHNHDVEIEIIKVLIKSKLKVNVEALTLRLDTLPEITEEDTVQAITHAFNKFCAAENKAIQYGSLLEFYDEMVGETVTRMTEFKKILENELFDLAFQPIVEVTTGKVAHFEVLTRLRDLKVFANPFDFIEFGENAGLIPDFDFKVTMKSLSVIKQMAARGIYPILSINLSGNSLSNMDFMDKIYEVLIHEIEYCPQIIFEITESARVSNAKLANGFFKKLKRLGIKCCIDDFGAGEATFEYLRHFKVDIVKIDGSYLSEEALESSNGRQLLHALSRLCEDIGVEVVGEKVETAEAAQLLADANIKYAQGYFYAKPSLDLESLKITQMEHRVSKVTNIKDWRKS